jgi:hypothetical protein
MADPVASFALRGATAEELGLALGRCFGEFVAWHGQAAFVANFVQDARVGRVRAVLAERIRQALDFGEAQGLIINMPAKAKSNQEIARVLADHQLAMADQGVKISAIVMLHSACERFLWRLVRFGLVVNREQMLKWIAKRNVTVETLTTQGVDTPVDAHIERWWEELERDTLVNKWDRLVGLVGFPTKLSDPPWRFDRKMLADFDDVRHNAVHHDAQAVKAFDFGEFAGQLWRAQLVWVVQVALRLKVKIPAETLFTGSKDSFVASGLRRFNPKSAFRNGGGDGSRARRPPHPMGGPGA